MRESDDELWSEQKEVVISPLADWREEFDHERGRAYFYNQNTGESRWTMPSETQPKVSVNELVMWISKLDQKSGCVYYVNRVTGETSWTKPVQNEAKRNPLAKWAEERDAATGKAYFVNLATGEAQWTAPVGYSVWASAKSEVRSRGSINGHKASSSDSSSDSSSNSGDSSDDDDSVELFIADHAPEWRKMFRKTGNIPADMRKFFRSRGLKKSRAMKVLEGNS